MTKNEFKEKALGEFLEELRCREGYFGSRCSFPEVGYGAFAKVEQIGCEV